MASGTINNDLRWKRLTVSAVGSTEISLPSSFSEIYVRTMVTAGGYEYAFTMHLLSDELGTTNKYYCGGLANGSDSQYILAAKYNTIHVDTLYFNGTNRKSDAVTYVAYR